MAEPERRRSWTLRISILVLILLLLLLLRGCPQETEFDYFRHQASELGNDAARVEKFVANDVETLPYSGNVKGALGALWGRAGSVDEKNALKAALLAHCEGDAPATPAASRPVYVATITHGSESVYKGPIADLVGAVHTIDVPKKGTIRFTLRRADGKATQVRNVPASENVVFTVERPGGDPLVVTRELWHAENRVGLTSAEPGDRHDFVVLPCRMTKFVQEKEKLILKERGEDEAPHAHPYEGLIEYALAADKLLADLETHFKARAQFDLPRILILTTIDRGEDEISYAFDLRLNRTSFTAADPINAYMAAQVRSLLESGLEHEFLMKWSKTGGLSAFDTFNRLRDEYPNTFDRRVRAIHDSVVALRKHGGSGARAVFRVKDRPGPEVTAEWKAGGLHVSGGALRPGFADALREREGAPKLDGPYDDTGDAAAAIETMLLAADVDPSVAPNYTLETDMSMGGEPLVVPSARFTLEWGEGKAKVRQRLQVRECKEGLEYTFHTRRGLRTAAGTLTVAPEAVAGATHHNPHYRSGTRKQEDTTSFCVSRRVYDALKSGGSTPFALRAEFTKTDDPKAPRPVAWEGKLVSAGTREREVTINGKPVTVKLLVAKLEGGTPPLAEVAILDDARWPVGRADALTSIQTSVRGRLLDEHGLGIGRALVAAGEGEGVPSTITWPDGRFRLPPPKEGESHGKIKLVVTQKLGEEKIVKTLDVDLTAPGLDEVEVKVDRARNKVVWITPKQEAELDKLGRLSPQIKRHARNHLRQQRIVIIPERTLDDGMYGLAAFYSFDPKTGHSIGVTEDGLHGTAANWMSYTRATGKATGKALDAMVLGDGLGGMTPIHAMRGANTAMFMFATYRLQGKSSGEAAGQLLNEMEMWEARTNLFTNLEEGAGGDAAGYLRDKMGAVAKNVDGDAAKAAFYAGYIIATAYLHNQLK